jgi:hypothetical protein
MKKKSKWCIHGVDRFCMAGGLRAAASSNGTVSQASLCLPPGLKVSG